MSPTYRIPEIATSGTKEEYPPSSADAARLRWRSDGMTAGARCLPEETPVAITYNRLSHAVMMMTPGDLADFALGFTLNEGIVERPEEIEELEIVPAADGAMELRLWIAAERMERLEARRRHLTGAMGCGLCGLESLADAMRPSPAVPRGLALAPEDIAAAVASLSANQPLSRLTRAVHAAGYWTAAEGLVALREDVGRHNALDKLAGGLVAAGRDASGGVLVMTSRVSIELIQKAAVMGVQVLAAISAPTLLAIRAAEASGMTLIGVARDDGFEVFAGAERIVTQGPVPAPHVGTVSA